MCLKPACSTCNKTVSNRNWIICAQWIKSIHFKCNNLNCVDGQLIKIHRSWFCLLCSNNIFPFTNITNKKLQSVFDNGEYHLDDYIYNSTKTCLVLKSQENLTDLFNEFNNLSSDENNNWKNIINCKYYDIDEIQTLNKLNNNSVKLNNTLCRFFIFLFSLKKYCRSWILLNSTSINFDVVAISEIRIVEGKSPVNSLKLMKYSHEFFPTESSAVGTLLYIHNHLSYKPWDDLCIYKATELESPFIEISNPKRSNIIIGCFYRHPNMDLDEFNDNYLNNLLDKISKENKFDFLLCDFKVDLLKYH